MAKYTFDENGDTFNYFVLTTLAIILIPATYLTIFRKTGKPHYASFSLPLPLLDKALAA